MTLQRPCREGAAPRDELTLAHPRPAADSRRWSWERALIQTLLATLLTGCPGGEGPKETGETGDSGETGETACLPEQPEVECGGYAPTVPFACGTCDSAWWCTTYEAGGEVSWYLTGWACDCVTEDGGWRDDPDCEAYEY